MGTRIHIAGPIAIHIHCQGSTDAILELAGRLHVQNAADRQALETAATLGDTMASAFKAAMDKLAEEVAERRTVSEGLRAYIGGLKQQLLDLAEAGAAAEQILEFAQSIDADNAADAVLINTPVPPQPIPPDEV